MVRAAASFSSSEPARAISQSRWVWMGRGERRVEGLEGWFAYGVWGREEDVG